MRPKSVRRDPQDLSSGSGLDGRKPFSRRAVRVLRRGRRAFQSERRNLDPVVEVKLIQNVVNVTSSGAFRNNQLHRNLPVRESLGYESQHIELPPAENARVSV